MGTNFPGFKIIRRKILHNGSVGHAAIDWGNIQNTTESVHIRMFICVLWKVMSHRDAPMFLEKLERDCGKI